MEIQDQNKTTTPTGYESHGVQICHRCGWPFPNPHPSSKHRRAHKRICGTIEGYTNLIDSKPISDDEHHSDEEIEKTPSPKIEKRIIKEGGGIEERSNRSEDDLFSDAVTDFSDTGISPGAEERFIDTTKLLDNPIEIRKADENIEVFETPDTHTKDADETEENDINTVCNLADTQIKLPDSETKTSDSSVEDRDGSCKDKLIDLMECSNSVTDSAKAMDVSSGDVDTFEVSGKDQGEEAVYVLSIPSDIPLVDHSETLIDDFKDHGTIYSNVPLVLGRDGDKDAENRSMVDTFEVKTAEEKIQESQTSENGKSSMESEHTKTDLAALVPTVVIEEAKVAGTQPLEMSKTVPESKDNLIEAEVSVDKCSAEGDSKRSEIDPEQAPEVVKRSEIDHGVPVLTQDLASEIVKEPESGFEVDQKKVESVGADSKDIGNLGISQRSEKAEQSPNASRIVSGTLVDEDDGKLMTSQDSGVDVSVGSSSRNSLEGNWGSVSVLSTASIDAENAHSIGKSEIAADKRRLGKSDAFEGQSLVESKEEIVDQKASEIKEVTMQNSQPPKSEANIVNETEGRKRNEEAIAKVTNWSTDGHPTTTPLKNLVTEAKSSNPKQLSTTIQKDEVAEKTSEPGKPNLTSETPPVNHELSPPEYIGEGKKVRKKAKGRSSWIPFACCSSVNVS